MRKQSRTSSSPKESMEVFWVCFCLKEMVQNVLAIPAFPRLQSEGSLRCHALKGKKSLDILVKQNMKKIDVGQNIKEHCQLHRGMREALSPSGCSDCTAADPNRKEPTALTAQWQIHLVGILQLRNRSAPGLKQTHTPQPENYQTLLTAQRP